MKTIPFLDLSRFNKKNKKNLSKLITNVVDSSDFILSSEVKKFEDSFSLYCNSKYCVSVANGLDALKLLLIANNIGLGDEVIVPANTFIATWLSVSHVGAIPVPVEPDILTNNIDPKKIEDVISNKTKAIVGVHLYGRPSDMASLKIIAKKYKILLFEDMAQAHGAKFNGKKCGSLADGAAVSFYPGKNLGAFGDAGAILINKKSIYKKLLQLRNYGSLIKYHHELKGYNSRMDEVQAAILNYKLNFLKKENLHREKIAMIYIKNLGNVGDIITPSVDDIQISSWHLFVIRTKKRNSLMTFLKANGVATVIHYPKPPHLQMAYKSDYKHCKLPITEILSKQILSLPIYGYINISEVRHVIKLIKKFFETIK